MQEMTPEQLVFLYETIDSEIGNDSFPCYAGNYALHVLCKICNM